MMRSGPRPKRPCARHWMPTGWITSKPTGEAAFYGPKADFLARDVLGREWQLSTIQVDFIQPARLGLTYIGEDGGSTRRWCCTGL